MSRRLEIVAAEGPLPVWTALRLEAQEAAANEPGLASLLNATILAHHDLASALSYQVARKLGDQEMRAMSVREMADQAYASDPSLLAKVEADLRAVVERDAACRGYLQPFLFFKGFQALQTHRIAHWLWTEDRPTLAFHFQSRMSELFQVDIHPAAKFGSGVFMDHVSMLHGVTLGGTGAERGDRHPKIMRGVLLGAGAKVLGNVTIGEYAKVASGSVVLKNVPPGCTAAGVPARLVNCPTCEQPARTMDHTLPGEVYGDYVI